MKIENTTKSKRIELTVVEAENSHYPSYRIQIGIKTEEFEGTFDRNTWLSEVDIDAFSERLSIFDQTRSGFEKLNSMSPDEFQLGFKNIDDLGHISAQIQLKKKSTLDPSYSDLLRVEFEVDPSSIGETIVALHALKRNPNMG